MGFEHSHKGTQGCECLAEQRFLWQRLVDQLSLMAEIGRAGVRESWQGSGVGAQSVKCREKVCTRVPPKFWNMPSERLTKCVAQADVVVSSLDETRNVGDRERIVESNLNISMVRPEGGEGIRSNLGSSF